MQSHIAWSMAKRSIPGRNLRGQKVNGGKVKGLYRLSTMNHWHGVMRVFLLSTGIVRVFFFQRKEVNLCRFWFLCTCYSANRILEAVDLSPTKGRAACFSFLLFPFQNGRKWPFDPWGLRSYQLLFSLPYSAAEGPSQGEGDDMDDRQLALFLRNLLPLPAWATHRLRKWPKIRTLITPTCLGAILFPLESRMSLWVTPLPAWARFYSYQKRPGTSPITPTCLGAIPLQTISDNYWRIFPVTILT